MAGPPRWCRQIGHPEANLRASLRSSLPKTSIAGPHSSAIRVSSAPDPLWDGRDVYAISVQMPNVTSYSGSWLIWFAQRREESSAGGVLTLPVPCIKWTPSTFPRRWRTAWRATCVWSL